MNWITDGSKPSRADTYNVSCNATEQTGQWFAYWDGEKWAGQWALQRELAIKYYNGYTGGSSTPKSWRPLDVLVTVPAKMLVNIRPHDGSELGDCLYCGAGGWTNDEHQITHRAGCVVGLALNHPIQE